MRLPVERAARACSCSSIPHQGLPLKVYQGYYPVFAVVCPCLSVSRPALEMCREVMLSAYPIDLE